MSWDAVGKLTGALDVQREQLKESFVTSYSEDEDD